MHRRWEGRPPYDTSCWGRMLVNPRTKDPTDRKGGVLFCRRFRVPFPLFQILTEMTRANERFSEGKDCAGVQAAPLELKVLGVLWVLGRGYCFDGIEELSFISGASCFLRNTSAPIAILQKPKKRSRKLSTCTPD